MEAAELLREERLGTLGHGPTHVAQQEELVSFVLPVLQQGGRWARSSPSLWLRVSARASCRPETSSERQGGTQLTKEAVWLVNVCPPAESGQ
jgi:hypothetical protein